MNGVTSKILEIHPHLPMEISHLLWQTRHPHLENAHPTQEMPRLSQKMRVHLQNLGCVTLLSSIEHLIHILKQNINSKLKQTFPHEIANHSHEVNLIKLSSIILNIQHFFVKIRPTVFTRNIVFILFCCMKERQLHLSIIYCSHC
jgi:hypothetical protein